MAKNSKDERILSALLTSNTIKETAALVGVSEQAIYKRLKDDVFMSRYNEAKTNIIKQSTTYLQGRISNAVKVIEYYKRYRGKPSKPLIRCKMYYRYVVENDRTSGHS